MKSVLYRRKEIGVALVFRLFISACFAGSAVSGKEMNFTFDSYCASIIIILLNVHTILTVKVMILIAPN